MEISQILAGIGGFVALALGTVAACAIAGGNRRLDDQEEGLTALEIHQLISDEQKD